MTGLLSFVLLCLIAVSKGIRNATNDVYRRRLTDSKLYASKRTVPKDATCPPPEIENADPIGVESVPPRLGAWTLPIHCKEGYSLIGPCRLICKADYGGTLRFSPPYGLETPSCVKDYASYQFRCNYLSSVCPIVWDNDPEPTQPRIAISRIFCGQIQRAQTNNMQVYGFGASKYATDMYGDRCMYKGGIKDDPCYMIKGQRMVPVARDSELPAITYLGNMDGYEALSGSEDPYIGKLSRQIPYYLFPPDIGPSTLVSSLREYLTTCVKRNGEALLQCNQIVFITSANSGYDTVIGGQPIVKGILDAFPIPPGKKCEPRQSCCCDLTPDWQRTKKT